MTYNHAVRILGDKADPDLLQKAGELESSLRQETLESAGGNATSAARHLQDLTTELVNQLGDNLGSLHSKQVQDRLEVFNSASNKAYQQEKYVAGKVYEIAGRAYHQEASRRGLDSPHGIHNASRTFPETETDRVPPSANTS